MSEQPWEVIGLGQSGWHAETKNVRSSSYDPTDRQLHEYAASAIDGAQVYDASKADYGTFANFVISGPICQVGLKEECEFFSPKQREAALAMCGPGGLSGGYDTLVLLEATQAANPEKRYSGFGGFDYVSPRLYVSLLRKHVPGVRFGQVQGGKVVWES